MLIVALVEMTDVGHLEYGARTHRRIFARTSAKSPQMAAQIPQVYICGATMTLGENCSRTIGCLICSCRFRIPFADESHWFIPGCPTEFILEVAIVSTREHKKDVRSHRAQRSVAVGCLWAAPHVETSNLIGRGGSITSFPILSCRYTLPPEHMNTFKESNVTALIRTRLEDLAEKQGSLHGSTDGVTASIAELV